MDKMSPTGVKHALGFKPSALSAIMDLEVRDNKDCQDSAINAVMTFSSIRAEHAHAILSKNCKFHEPSSNGKEYIPRSFRFSLEYDKNLRAGSSTRVEKVALTKIIPCICADGLKGAELKKFKRQLQKDPINTECDTDQCPYIHILCYLKYVPDPYGIMREGQILNCTNSGQSTANLPSLKLFRARATKEDRTGNRKFLDTPLGNPLLLSL
jgi:hypothetical protein